MYRQNYSMAGSIAEFMYKVYGWMAAGLALTAGTAYLVFSTPSLYQPIFSNWILIFGLFLAQVVLVVALSGFVMRMSLQTAIAVFLGYSILSGVTLSSIFFVYTASSIYLAFAVAAATFGTMALYGYFTKDDLTGVGSIARMGLYGVIIALIINWFMQSAQVDYVISLIGVGVFTLLTAYDSQKIKQMGYMMIGQGELMHKVALLGALTLYLDFINLFLMLLRLFGNRREQ
jgi:FtsH-binding integral membrane protein